jgi:hypothetical protein
MIQQRFRFVCLLVLLGGLTPAKAQQHLAPTWLSQIDAIDAQVTDLAPEDMAWDAGPAVANLLPLAPQGLSVDHRPDRLAVTWQAEQPGDFMLLDARNLAIEAWQATSRHPYQVLDLKKLSAGPYRLTCNGQAVYELRVE